MGLRYAATTAITIVFLVSACKEPAPTQNAGRGAPPVTVATPLTKQIREWDEYVGRFEAVNEISIRARVSGFVDRIEFTDGQLVNKGQLLFVIDQRPFRIAVEQAEAALKRASSQLTLAERELARAEPLVKRGNLSRSAYDERLQNEQVSRAAKQEAEAILRAAQLDLEFTEVKAPFDGRISRRLVSEGALITGGTETATELTTLVSIDPLYFYFDVSEAAYLKYARLSRSGSRPSSRETPNPVKLSLLDENDYRHEGLMNFVDTNVDQGSGTVTGRALVPNPNGLLIPGLFAKVRLLGSGEYEATLVPDDIIGTDQSNKFVYVVDDDSVANYRRVTLGPMIDGLRVIRSGLDAGETVVINGLMRIRPGAKVTPKKGEIRALTETAEGQTQ